MRLLALGGILALLLAGCGGGGGEAELSAAEIVARAVERTGEVKSFHFALDLGQAPLQGAGLRIEKAEGDVVVPDRVRASFSGTFGGIALESELVIVGEDDFLKDPLTGRWRRLEIATSPLDYFDPARGVLAVMRALEDLELAGTEQVGGVDAYRLTATASARDVSPLLAVEPSGRRVPVELWVGSEDFLLRRLRVEGPVAEGEPEDVVRTVDVSRFDEPVRIEKPEVAG
ncbi:MAG TPA: LppX_LprAFG lipoprotein [Gaiellaceae bacterium]|nr:LppX_LprAFG lipoprotein [Gaiellaceae bacterium]